MKLFYYTLFFIIISYLVVFLFMFFFQRTFMYHPNVNSYNLAPIRFTYEKVKIPSENNITLESWHSFKSNQNKTLVFFHGNAGNLNNRIYKLNELDKLDLNFLIISWRGFSGNAGKPTEQGLYQDAASAIRWLETKNIKKTDIILYGESLGTGIALELAKKDIYAGVILESPYTSMVEMAKKFYPYLPVSILLRDRYQSIKKIKMNKSPILIMHGQMDTLVPFYMGEQLYAEASQPKQSYFPKFDNHMMQYTSELLTALKNFIGSLK